MKTFKQFFEDFDFDVEDLKAKIKARGPVVKKERVAEPKVLTLYHGFNTDPKTFNYVFDPKRSEQNLLWFTHSMIRGYDPKEYASSRGDYLLTYPLKATVHSDLVTYQNGEQNKKAPDELVDLAEPTSNSRFLPWFDSVIELPEGWFFTYKSEKFIGTNQMVKVNPSMVQKTATLV